MIIIINRKWVSVIENDLVQWIDELLFRNKKHNKVRVV